MSDAPKVVGGNFIWTGNEAQVSYTEIKKHTKVGGRIITDAPLSPEEKEDFRQTLIKEQKAFLAEYKKVGKVLELAVENKNIKRVEACRAYFYKAIDFFKERPWMTAQGMKISYQILMKTYAHLHDLAPEKYPDIIAESSKLSKLTDRFKYPDGINW